MATESSVPCGWAAVRDDFAHFCRVHRAVSRTSRIRLLLLSRSFWALAVYRYGRWACGGGRRALRVPLRALYAVLFETGRLVSKTALNLHSRIAAEVWFAPQGEIFVSQGSTIGRGAMLHGGNTLGVGGRPGARGHPQIGERVVFAPGASAVGPLEIPDGTIVGANALVGRTLPRAGFWMGVPPKAVTADKARIPGPAAMRHAPAETRMQPEPFWPSFRADLRRYLVYAGGERWHRLRVAVTSDGAWAMAVYRFGRSLRTQSLPLQPLLWCLYRACEILVGIATSISIDLEARIAPGFYVGHFVSVRIGAGAVIGRNSSVSQMCTIEGSGHFPERNAPVIGDRVYLGSGAKVIGPLRIGDGAAICANSVVVEDVPDNGVVLGNPGVVISRRGSADFIYLGEGAEVGDESAPAQAVADGRGG